MENRGQIWVIEFSKRQHQFNIESLDHVLATNLHAYLKNEDGDRDYVPLALAASHDEASRKLDELRQKRSVMKINEPIEESGPM